MKKQKTFKLGRRLWFYVLSDFKNLITSSGIDYDSVYDSNYHEVRIINPKTRRCICVEPRLTIYYK